MKIGKSEMRSMKGIPSASVVELVGNQIPEEGRIPLLLVRKREGVLSRSPDPNRA